MRSLCDQGCKNRTWRAGLSQCLSDLEMLARCMGVEKKSSMSVAAQARGVYSHTKAVSLCRFFTGFHAVLEQTHHAKCLALQIDVTRF